MRPQLHAPYFTFAGDATKWVRMARVLEASARQHCPEWDLHIDHIDGRLIREPPFNRSANASKLYDWVRRVCEAPDGARLLVMDSDMVIQRPIDDIWEREFDIAFTRRERPRLPINGGVVFVRVSDLTRDFFRAWLEMQVVMLKDRPLHRRFHATYGGQNQAALGAMIAQKHKALKAVHALWLPCSEWNVADPEWLAHWRTGRILHMKGDLRRVTFGGTRKAALAKLDPLVSYWHGLEAALGV